MHKDEHLKNNTLIDTDPDILLYAGILVLPLVCSLTSLAFIESLPSVCLYKALTGKPCWGCGMTRALVAFFHGSLPQAVAYNPRVLLVVPIFFVLWVVALSKFSSRIAHSLSGKRGANAVHSLL